MVYGASRAAAGVEHAAGAGDDGRPNPPVVRSGYAFGHTFTAVFSGITSAGQVTIDYSAFILGKTVGLDKTLKALVGVVAIRLATLRELTGSAPENLVLLQGRMKLVNDQIAGICNLPERYADFTTRDAAGNIELFKKGRLKVANRALLIVANGCEFLIMLKTWGVDLSRAALLVGQMPVFKIAVSYGIGAIKDRFVIVSSILAIVDCGLTFNRGWEVDKAPRPGQVLRPQDVNLTRFKAALGVANDGGKIALITFGMMGFATTYAYGWLILGTNLAALAKIALEKYKEDQKNAEKAQEAIRQTALRTMKNAAAAADYTSSTRAA